MDLSTILFNFLSNLFGAGLGAYLGYRYGVQRERNMREEEEVELRKETIKSLLKELERNLSILNDKNVLVQNRANRTLPIQVHPITTSSYESAVASGRLSLMSPLNQISLSEYHESCKRIMNRVLVVETKYGISNSEVLTYINEINAIGESLVDHITNIMEYLKSEL
jgi:hypothetical protein